MQRKSLLAAVLAAAFALPLAVQAANDKTAGAKTASAGDGGAEAMFKSMDRNGDGFISKDEAKGSPHAAEFATLDRNRDGKLSRAEHAASPGHANAARAGANAQSSAPTSAAEMATRKIQ